MPTAASAKVQLRNPDPKKKGPRMDKATYAVVRKAALATLPATAPGMTLEEFRSALADRLARTKGWDQSLSAMWYGMAIKLDLEARGELKRWGNSTAAHPRMRRDMGSLRVVVIVVVAFAAILLYVSWPAPRVGRSAATR